MHAANADHQAGLGAGTAIWITEIGFATNLGHTEARQASELGETVDAVEGLSGTLGVTDSVIADQRKGLSRCRHSSQHLPQCGRG